MTETVTRAIALVERLWHTENERTVMVSLNGAYGTKVRHVALRQDNGGFYVRLGKRGQVKRYLADMAGARISNERLGVAVFHEF